MPTSADKSRTDRPDQRWAELPSVGPYPAAIGSALITLVEPHEGHDHSYNRWYEDDHYNSGAMAFPWMFAGRRWVATKPLQELRRPPDSPICQPLGVGKYLSTYFVTNGRYKEHFYWAVATNKRLNEDDRVHDDRTHVFTNFQYYLGATYRDPDGPRDIHALDYPYEGLVLEVMEAPAGVDRSDLDTWLDAEHLPAAQQGSPIAMSLRFEPIPMPRPKDRDAYVEDVSGLDRWITVLHLLEQAPADCWSATFGDDARRAKTADARKGRTVLVAPFIPTLPGTDRYVDKLR